ncbi:BspA family leucine-rich repeat surface protein [Fructobacillus sp. M158]|uniref:BspA family leucine-rich repeat surface protein n=1 Tax=Fructobacillus parabroussonetiae TaxID=2713174 RepID=UPI00200AB140|nr:BspA family leucine-rich repeat surface protein [Fructobacillus parabroussonetiae]MCK8616895.1 BspA family leucine-rich repeat surface protein [Fructobacillus parabroussonetiae]
MTQTRIDRYNQYLQEHQLKTKLQKKGLALSLTSLAAFGGIGLTANMMNGSAVPEAYLSASADTTPTTGKVGTISYSYNDSTKTLTFTSGGEANDAGKFQFYQLFPNVEHIVFTNPVSLSGNIDTAFAYLPSLKDFTGFNLVDVSQADVLAQFFQGDSSLKSVDLSNFKTGKATEIESMFQGCSSLKSVDVSTFDTSNISDLIYMFQNCTSLKSLDLSKFNFKNSPELTGLLSNTGNGQSFYLKLPAGVIFGVGDMISGSGDASYSYFTPVDETDGGTLSNPKGRTMTEDDFSQYFANGGSKDAEWYVLNQSGKSKVVNQEKTVKRVINYKDVAGNAIAGQNPTVQVLKYHRTETTDPLGNVSDSDWTPDDASAAEFAAVDVPQTIDGKYVDPKVNGTASTKIDAEKPSLDKTVNEQDENVDVVYSEQAPTPNPTPTPNNGGNGGDNKPANNGGNVTPNANNGNDGSGSNGTSKTLPVTNGASSKTQKPVERNQNNVLPATAEESKKENSLLLLTVGLAATTGLMLLTKSFGKKD